MSGILQPRSLTAGTSVICDSWGRNLTHAGWPVIVAALLVSLGCAIVALSFFQQATVVPKRPAEINETSSASPRAFVSPIGKPAMSQQIVSVLFPGMSRSQSNTDRFLVLTSQLLDRSQPLALRRRAAWQIAQIQTDEALKVLGAALLTAPAPLRATIAEALGQSMSTSARELLTDLLRDDDPAVVRGALRGLAASGDQGAATLLSLLLADRQIDPTLRAEAALALGSTSQPTVTTILMKFADSTIEWEIRSAAIIALGKKPFEETQVFFRGFVDADDIDTDLRVAALESLGQATGNVTPFLVSYLGSDEAKIRAAAAWAMANLTDPGPIATPLMARLQNEAEPEVRTRLYQALENQERKDPSPLVGFILNDPDSGARVAGLKLLAAAVAGGADVSLRTQFDQLAVPQLSQLAVKGADMTIRVSSVIALRQAATVASRRALEQIAAQSSEIKIVQAAQLY